MYNILSDTEKPVLTFNGFYRGIVIDNNDPLKAGRIKIRIYPMFQGVADADLPWALMADPFMGGFANTGGSFIPSNNAHVFCFFEGADHRFPVFFAGAPAIENGVPDLPQEAQTNYPNNHVIRTKNGIVIEMDDTAGSVRLNIKHPSGSKEEITNAGNRTTITVGNDTIIISGNQTVTISGNQTVNVSGDNQVTASGNLTLTGTNVTVTSSGPLTISGLPILLN